jgi:hypothetical protein
VLRLLLPLLAALALVGAPLVSWAALEQPDPTCCCPDPELCTCDDDAPGEPAVQRCSRDAAPLVLPGAVPAVLTAPPVIAPTVAAPAPWPPAPPALAERAPDRPEKPPS